MADNDRPILYALFGLNRAGQILWALIFIGGIAWFVNSTMTPGRNFSDADERLFRAARHGDKVGIEQALASGAGVNDISPIDGATALFRAAAFGHADAVKALLDSGADREAHAWDSQTALDRVIAFRNEEKEPGARRALDDVATVLRGGEGGK